MNAHRHLLAIVTLAAVVGASPAHAGLLGGSGTLGGSVGVGAGSLNGNMNGQGALPLPPQKPLIRATRDKEAAVQDHAAAARATAADKAQQAKNAAVSAAPVLQGSGSGEISVDRQGAQAAGALNAAAHR